MSGISSYYSFYKAQIQTPRSSQKIGFPGKRRFRRLNRMVGILPPALKEIGLGCRGMVLGVGWRWPPPATQAEFKNTQ